MTPIEKDKILPETLIRKLDRIMSEIPAIITADPAMSDKSKEKLSQLYDSLLILKERLES